MTLTEIQSRVTKTAAFAGAGLDVSGISGDWTLCLQVESLVDSVSSNTPSVRFAFEDTVNDFTVALAGPTISFKGTLGVSYDKVKKIKKQDFPDLRPGTASAQLRLRLSNMPATSTCVYRAWIEY